MENKMLENFETDYKEFLIKQLTQYIQFFDENELTDLLFSTGKIVVQRKIKSMPCKKANCRKQVLEVADWLSENLNKNSVSIANFAKMCRIHRFSIYRYLSGKSHPTEEIYEKMKVAFEFLELNSKKNELGS